MSPDRVPIDTEYSDRMMTLLDRFDHVADRLERLTEEMEDEVHSKTKHGEGKDERPA